jgi:hypothetical protein
MTENATGVPIIDRASMETFLAASESKSDDVKAFVTLSENLKDFPPVYVRLHLPFPIHHNTPFSLPNPNPNSPNNPDFRT